MRVVWRCSPNPDSTAGSLAYVGTWCTARDRCDSPRIAAKRKSLRRSLHAGRCLYGVGRPRGYRAMRSLVITLRTDAARLAV
jgi:hypothetical protein